MPTSAKHASLLVLLLGLAACASLPRGDGLRPAHLERLYFGRNIGDTAVVSDSAWATFVHDVVTPTFPEGSTIWDAAGNCALPTERSCARRVSSSSSCTS